MVQKIIKKDNKTIFKGMCLQDGPAGVRFTKGHSISWKSNLTCCNIQ